MAFDHGWGVSSHRWRSRLWIVTKDKTKIDVKEVSILSAICKIRSAFFASRTWTKTGMEALRCRNKDKPSMSCVIMMLSKCRSPIPSKYVAIQYLTCTITQTHASTWTHICHRNRSPGVWPCSAPAKLIIGRWHWTGTWLFVISSLLTPNDKRWSKCQLGLEQLRDGQCFFRNWLMSPSNSWTKIDIGTESTEEHHISSQALQLLRWRCEPVTCKVPVCPSQAVQIAEKGLHAQIRHLQSTSCTLCHFCRFLIMSFHHVQLQESCHIVLLSLHFVLLVHVCMLYSSLCPHACMRACAVASDGVGMWGLTSLAVPYIQAHMTHIMWEKVEFGTACLPPQRQGISCNCVQYLYRRETRQVDSMLGRQVRLLECAQECCYNVVGGASEWTRWNQ